MELTIDSPTACRAFLDQWGDIAAENPHAGKRHAIVGRNAAERLKDPALIARAQALVASSYRATGDLDACQQTFEDAEKKYWHLRKIQSGKLQETILSDEADMYRRRAFYYADRQNFRQALDDARRAAKLHQALNDAHEYGHSLAAMGTVCIRAGRYEEALKYLAEGLANLDSMRRPGAIHAAASNVVIALIRSQPSPEQLSIAMEHLKDARKTPLGRKRARRRPASKRGRTFGQRDSASVPDCKLRWAQALILRRHSFLDIRAKKLLEEAYADLAELGCKLELVELGLDLGDVYADLAEWESLEQVSLRALEILHSVDQLDTPDALVAWQRWRQAARMQKAETVTRAAELCRSLLRGEG